MSTAAIEAHGLRFCWPSDPQPLLTLPHLHLATGQSLFVGGPSGCGKSTLLGLLSGVLSPSQGQLMVLGRPLHALGPSARDQLRGEAMGVIFQQFNLLPYLSLMENVLLPTRLSARRAADARKTAGSPRSQAQALLEQLQIPGRLWQAPAHQVSVGQQQRVAVARALMGSPSLVIADEPTSALDESARQAFLDLLLGLGRERGCSLVMVSHDLRMASLFDHQLQLGARP